MMSGRSEQNVPVVTDVMVGWSAQYGAVIADVRDLLIAAVDAARGATPELLAKLMQRVQRLSSVLELSVDCTGMSTEKMAKMVRQAAKHFLSSIHGRDERNQMRRGTAKLRKARAAVMAAIEAQMQRRTKHEIYKHQRNMEQVRLAGRMRRYIKTLHLCEMKLSASLPTSPCLYQLLMLQVNRWWMRMVSW
jgi:hypothetical protein